MQFVVSAHCPFGAQRGRTDRLRNVGNAGTTTTTAALGFYRLAGIIAAGLQAFVCWDQYPQGQGSLCEALSRICGDALARAGVRKWTLMDSYNYIRK